MKRFVHLPTLAAFLAVAAILGYVLGRWTGFGFWGAFVLIALALLFNGWLAIAEDEAPGGFNNPDPVPSTTSMKKRRWKAYTIINISVLAVIGICIMAAIVGAW